MWLSSYDGFLCSECCIKQWQHPNCYPLGDMCIWSVTGDENKMWVIPLQCRGRVCLCKIAYLVHVGRRFVAVASCAKGINTSAAAPAVMYQQIRSIWHCCACISPETFPPVVENPLQRCILQGFTGQKAAMTTVISNASVWWFHNTRHFKFIISYVLNSVIIYHYYCFS